MRRQRFGPLGKALLGLRPQLAVAAQRAYDAWDADDEFCEIGDGGICDIVADGMGSVVANALGDVEIFDGGQDGADHAWIVVVAVDRSEAYEVDVPPGVYERGGGYRWKKIPGVTIGAEDVIVEPIDPTLFDE